MEKGPCLDTVRALHQTVVALRKALEESRSEILELKSKAWPIDSVEDAFRALSVENHVLRNQLCVVGPIPEVEPEKNPAKDSKPEAVDTSEVNQEDPVVHHPETPREIVEKDVSNPKKNKPKQAKKDKNKRHGRIETKISIKTSTSISLDSLITLPSRFTETTMNNGDKTPVQSPHEEEDQDQEVDDIELIFTTDETKDSDFKEQLVSIETGDSQANLLQCPNSDLDQNLDISDRELDDDVFNDSYEPAEFQRENSQLYNSKSDNSINNPEEKSLKSCYSYQDSSFENRSMEKDESFDRFEDRIRIVETDISKCGIQEVEYSGARRYTCPNPLQYRPLPHREALAKGLNSRKTRPILGHSNAVRKESGAQTDISALPGSSWLSESSLANKTRAGENFTTLPSKYPMPGSRLRLSEKTVEARRVLLSDIGFTSMVPELSRSADHLCPTNASKQPVVYGQFLKTSDFQSPGFTSQKFTWTQTTATPSEGSYSQSRYNSLYPLPSPPSVSRRCSAPVSPSRRAVLKSTPSKVRFANGSLPELRGDWSLTIDSGDSTDSLVEEAESYLRRSIDCIVTHRDPSERKKPVPRRASAPEPSGDNVPPQGWQPFLPRVPRDLKPDHWVKVILPEGRVRGGRVRYIGPVITQTDYFVGVQLSTPDGHSDGTYSNRRYFQCEPYHGIMVPFKKVIMGWRP